jgi:hypothetical protein
MLGRAFFLLNFQPEANVVDFEAEESKSFLAVLDFLGILFI